MLDALLAAKPAAVAINFLFSWKNAAHEVAAEARLRARLENAGFDPALCISRSSEILAEAGEYERGMATWLNASLSPKVRAYLERLGKALGPTRLDIMASHGGTLAPASPPATLYSFCFRPRRRRGRRCRRVPGPRGKSGAEL